MKFTIVQLISLIIALLPCTSARRSLFRALQVHYHSESRMYVDVDEEETRALLREMIGFTPKHDATVSQSVALVSNAIMSLPMLSMSMSLLSTTHPTKQPVTAAVALSNTPTRAPTNVMFTPTHLSHGTAGPTYDRQTFDKADMPTNANAPNDDTSKPTSTPVVVAESPSSIVKAITTSEPTLAHAYMEEPGYTSPLTLTPIAQDSHTITPTPTSSSLTSSPLTLSSHAPTVLPSHGLTGSSLAPAFPNLATNGAPPQDEQLPVTATTRVNRRHSVRSARAIIVIICAVLASVLGVALVWLYGSKIVHLSSALVTSSNTNTVPSQIQGSVRLIDDIDL